MVPESSLPEETEEFVRRYITTIETLEILLFLHEHAEKAFSTEEVLKEIQSSRISIAQRLSELRDRKLILEKEDGNYQFKPISPELRENVEKLKYCYAVKRVKVIEAIYSRPVDGIQRFSNAFKFRKEK